MSILEILQALQILQELDDPLDSLEALRSYENPQEAYGHPSARPRHRGALRGFMGRQGMGGVGGMGSVLGIPSGARGGFSQVGGSV